MFNNIKKYFLSTLLLFFVFNKSSLATQSNYQITNDIIKEIESSLLFDNESRNKLDVYNTDYTVKKADYTINSGNNSELEAQKGLIDIVLVDENSQSFDVRKKEKLAYNSALVGQYEVAIELFKQVLKKEPKNQYSRFSLAVIYQQLGELEKAKILYSSLLKEDPKNREEIIGNLLAILIEENPKDASYLLSRLAIQSPKSSYILAQSAIVYDKLKKYDESINLLKRAIEIDPKNIGYKYNLAISYDKNSQYEEALKNYLEVVEDYSREESDNFIVIEEVQKRINAIKGAL